jgi:hypothetical protein
VWLQKKAFGVLGMTDEEFWNSTLRAFFYRWEGFMEWHESVERNRWEQLRWALCVNTSPHLKRPLKPKRLIKFPWEKSDLPSKEERRAHEKRLKKKYG